MMGICRQLAEWHPLLWAVPFFFGIAIAALGSRLGHRSLALLAGIGAGWPVLQGSAAAVFVLWGPSGGFDPLVRVDWMTEHLFWIGLSLDRTAVWGVLLLAAVSLGTQVYSLSAVARFAGRHRFYALLQLFLASGALLFTSRSAAMMLVGWEAMAVCVAFLAGFWESERLGQRTGMRWLLFQRMSGLLLLLGLIGLEWDVRLGLSLVVTAALVRAGQLPFHGWLRDSADAPAPAAALLYGAGSALAAVWLLDHFDPLIQTQPAVADALGVVGLAGVALGLLAGLQQHQPLRAVGWLAVMLGGFSLLGFAVGDPVASLLLVTGQTLVMAGLSLAMGALVGPVAEIRAVAAAPGLGRIRRAYLVSAAAWVLPPSLGYLAMGRLLAAAAGDVWGVPIAIAAGAGSLAGGWVAMRINLQLARTTVGVGPGNGRAATGMILASAALATLSFALGVAAAALYGFDVGGGAQGLAWACLPAGGALLGAGVGWLAQRRRTDWLRGRLTHTQRMMERVAETGLGIGEALVQLPVLAARALGVIVWRVIGDMLIDTLIVGTAYKTVEGIGIALRVLQNGRIQRYTLVAVITALLLMLGMLR